MSYFCRISFGILTIGSTKLRGVRSNEPNRFVRLISFDYFRFGIGVCAREMIEIRTVRSAGGGAAGVRVRRASIFGRRRRRRRRRETNGMGGGVGEKSALNN